MNPTAPTPPAADPAPVKCLIVDDLEENLLALGALLRSDDVEVLKARSGAEALELLLAHDVALAFLDVQMPDMDGFELAELIRGSERTRQVPLIFVTAGTRDQTRVFKGYDTGAVDFLYKPIEPRILQHKAAVFFQLYRQKRQLARELQVRTETLRLSELFIAVLGHDLRNPLSAMMNAARLLQRQSADAGVHACAARMLASGQRMSRLIEDLLDLARARLGGGLALRHAQADLDVALRRVVQEHQSASPDCPIELQVHGNTEGIWDVDRLAQVASNLIGNACQHGTPGSPVQVLLDGTPANEATLTVTNHGTVAPDLLDGLFDAFRGSRQARGEGLGLGLYIVQQIVQAHHGRIGVTSRDDITTFTVRIPRTSPQADAG